MNAGTVYCRTRRRKISDGEWLPRVPSGEARAHVEMLRAGGMSMPQIAAAAGLAVRTIGYIYSLDQINGSTAAAILEVRPEPRPMRADLVECGVGVSRRVRALVAIGWTLSAQAERLSLPVQRVWDIAHVRSPLITVATLDRVTALFEELSATPGPSRKARNNAVKHGWSPPLAWGDDIDDPNARCDTGTEEVDLADVVDIVAVRRALEGDPIPLNAYEQAEALRLGVARNESVTRLAARLGINAASARVMLAGELTPGREKRLRVEAAVVRMGATVPDSTIAALVDVHHQTVARARARLAKRQLQLAS